MQPGNKQLKSLTARMALHRTVDSIRINCDNQICQKSFPYYGIHRPQSMAIESKEAHAIVE